MNEKTLAELLSLFSQLGKSEQDKLLSYARGLKDGSRKDDEESD